MWGYHWGKNKISAHKFGRLCTLGVASLYLWAAPAFGEVTSPASTAALTGRSQNAPWHGKSGQAASGHFTRSEALKQLAAEWWQWVLSIPVPDNPLLDQTGENCVVGQRGPAWFLVGSFGGGETTRSCSVPEGRLIFFPVINSVNIDTPNVCGQGPERTPVGELRASSAAFVNGAVDVAVRLDGKRISNLARVKSKVFAVALPEDNLFDAPCASAGGVPAGIYSPAVDEGIYSLIKDLRKGRARTPVPCGESKPKLCVGCDLPSHRRAGEAPLTASPRF
jgi:hypothetical protein